jgi:hypothetical protein
MNPRCSSCQDLTSRVITEEESPAADPEEPSSAGAKSPVNGPRARAGSSSVTFGDRRQRAG